MVALKGGSEGCRARLVNPFSRGGLVVIVLSRFLVA